MSGREWCTVEEWLNCQRPLCPVVVRHEGRIDHDESRGIRVCFSSPKPGGNVLSDGTSQECVAFSSHPELLSLLPYVESLEDNEAIRVHGLQHSCIIHDLKNKAPFDANNKYSNNNNNNTSSSGDIAMCLMDAEDYSDLPIRQYEEDNVLRELNKAYIAFQQEMTQQHPSQRLPPVGASRGSSPTHPDHRSSALEMDRNNPEENGCDLTRSTTLVASSTEISRSSSLVKTTPDPGLRSVTQTTSNTHEGGVRPKTHRSTVSVPATKDKRPKDDESKSTHDLPCSTTLLYGGGRHVPLTLDKATCVKQLDVNDIEEECHSRRLSLGQLAKREGSIYNSCQSDDPSSCDEYTSARTSFDETLANDKDASQQVRCSDSRRRHSLPSPSSDSSDLESGMRRPGSRGFALDNVSEEDSFSGDGLEKEREWLEHFRERRGRSRSSPRDKDSSRYSFSSEYSSELDEMYEHFSHWLEDPEGKELDARDLAVFRFAHSLLKRALSDSFANVAMNIETLAQDARMKDIKLSSVSTTAEGQEADKRPGVKQRSWSLVDQIGDERLALQLAKEMVERTEPKPYSDEMEHQQHEEEQGEEERGGTLAKKLACQLNKLGHSSCPEHHVVLLDRMSTVEDEIPGAGTGNVCSRCQENAESKSNPDDSNSDVIQTPLNPTPPRTRRGSWIFKKSRERHKSKPGKDIPKQRARSNSVPAVMEFNQLLVWQSWKPSLIAEHRPSIPDIVVSGDNMEEDDCFQSPLAALLTQRRHHSFEAIHLKQSSESLLSDDVVEGFSYTMAETIIEDIFKEFHQKKALLKLPGSSSPKANSPCPKGILKNSSNDSLNRSHSGSLIHEEDHGNLKKDSFHQSDYSKPTQVNGENGISWSQRSTSMPSLRAIDEIEPKLDDVSDESHLMHNSPNSEKIANGGLRPIVTGNWGCGSQGGDPQLKSMLQWMAASRAAAPALIYYTCAAPAVVKLDIVCRIIMDRHWTVGDLAHCVLRYCRSRLDPRRLEVDLEACAHSLLLPTDSTLSSSVTRLICPPETSHSDCSSSGSKRWSSTGTSSSSNDRLLFDELLGQMPMKQTEL